MPVLLDKRFVVFALFLKIFIDIVTGRRRGKQADFPLLCVLIGKAYRFTRTFGKTPEETMSLILWTPFYFVQQERALSDKDDDVVLRALAAAKANAAFCKKGEEEGK